MTTLRADRLELELLRLQYKLENILFEQAEEKAVVPDGPDFDLWLENELHEAVLVLKQILDR